MPAEEFAWKGRSVRWESQGAGPPVVLCHGTPWSSALWASMAAALCREFTVYRWDMPGYGSSSKDPNHRVALDVQGEVFADLLDHWGLERPHVVAHDYGGVVSLRAHLIHGSSYASLALVDVVALAPWGTDFLRLVREHTDVFAALPPHIHAGLVRAYIEGASHHGLTEPELEMLAAPWCDSAGQDAFYRQIAEADQAYTDEIEPRYGSIDLPVLVVWGTEDTWLPVEQAHRLTATIRGARAVLIENAGHLIQLDAPAQLATTLHGWLASDHELRR